MKQVKGVLHRCREKKEMKEMKHCWEVKEMKRKMKCAGFRFRALLLESSRLVG